jgi:hypothetical protein
MGQFRGCDTDRCAQSQALAFLGYFQLAEYMGLLCLPRHSFPPQLSQPYSWNRLGLAITWWGVSKLLLRLPVPQSGPQVRISAFRQDSLTVSVQCAFPVRWRIYVSDYEHKMYSTVQL